MRIYTINFWLQSILYTLLTLSSPVLAETEFSELFLMEPDINRTISDRVAVYHSQNITLNLSQQERELTTIRSQLSALKLDNRDNAMFWFIKGLNHSNMASLYTSTKQADLVNQHIKLKNEAYETAIRLDHNEKKLSAAIYNTMKHGLPQDLKIEATQKELQQGGNGFSDSYYWYLHWSNIDQLKKAGRHDEAEAAFEQMQKELKESDMDPNIYGSLTQSIEKQTFNKQEQKKPESRPEPVKQESKPEEPAKEISEENFLIIILVIAAILLTAIVTFYELVIRKRKQKL